MGVFAASGKRSSAKGGRDKPPTRENPRKDLTSKRQRSQDDTSSESKSDEAIVCISVQLKESVIWLASTYMAHDSHAFPPYRLEEAVKEANRRKLPVIIGAISNSNNTIWGSSDTNSRERLIDEYIRQNIKNYNLSPNQQAYSKGKSVDTALHEIVSTIEKGLDLKENTLGVFLDIEGAFNNVYPKSVVNSLLMPGVQQGLQAVPIFWFICDTLTDVVFIFDIVVQLRTGYLEQGLMVYDDKKLAMHYIHSKDFFFDIISLIPLDLIQLKIGSHPLLRFSRFFKVYRCIKFYYIVESRTVWPNLWRVINLIHILLILAHWFGCFYYLLSEAEGFQGDWVYPYRPGDYATLTRKYLGSLYWSTLTLTTIGDLPTPETNAE
ncbi:cGMP-gated cation channel alpha-1-like [Rhagoletis pomonella]|uniref:cGMP-gated cation channel alpha-1-like n=1 Tax=Rhagoletis pomonella TaxID=28610 RepID=UPI00177A7622|nr:cGMP-gated cation channel alpha-1-like [Rhagoletis pomonella]